MGRSPSVSASSPPQKLTLFCLELPDERERKKRKTEGKGKRPKKERQTEGQRKEKRKGKKERRGRKKGKEKRGRNKKRNGGGRPKTTDERFLPRHPHQITALGIPSLCADSSCQQGWGKLSPRFRC